MFRYANILEGVLCGPRWENSKHFFDTIPKACVFTFKHQVVEFKIYVMPFFLMKGKIYSFHL